MKSFFGRATSSRARNRIPVGSAGRGPQLPIAAPFGMESQMRAYGGIGTLHAIVSRLSTGTAQPDWHLYVQNDDPDADKVPAENTLPWTVWNRPNKFYTSTLFVETAEQHLELTGESTWLVLRAGDNTVGPPLELWPIRPDRMQPVPSAENFLAGWIYTGPGGENIPLETTQVIQIKTPNPLDPYRGMSPVQAIMTDLESAKYAAEWNRNFFLNSAEPGGLIKVDRKLSDREWKTMVSRWREQHQGVNNAHRVAVLEEGEWVSNAFSVRDMQFPELRALSSETIREAFGFPKPLLGTVTDVNRANAEAAEVVFARWLIVPRLERIRDALNSQFLPMFGTYGQGIEFDFISPVPEDREGDAADLTAKTTALKTLIDAGFDPDEACDTVGLPRMKVVAKPDSVVQGSAPVPGASPQGPAPIPAPDDDTIAAMVEQAIHSILRNAGDHTIHGLLRGSRKAAAERSRMPADARREQPRAVLEETQLRGVRDDLETALERAMDALQPTIDDQIESLTEQVQRAVDDHEEPGDVVSALLGMTLTSDLLGVGVIQPRLQQMALTAARRAQSEADAEGVEIDGLTLTTLLGRDDLGFDTLALTAGTLSASWMVAQAVREATRLYRPDAPRNGAQNAISGSALARLVGDQLRAVGSDLRRTVAAALHAATNRGRYEAFRLALKVRPGAQILASEINDARRCEPCEEWDGHRFDNLNDAYELYANGGYPGCLGRDRCRGTFHLTWK